MAVTEESVLSALRKLVSPELVQELKVSGGTVSFTLVLTAPASADREKLAADVRKAVAAVPGVAEVRMSTSVLAKPAASRPLDQVGLGGVRNAIAIASGKGGVGKSTVSVNVAVALARQGAKVGLMDADIYGPNVPLMMGLTELPPLQDQKIVPAENFGVKVMSMGFLLKPDDAVIWRGPMLHGAVSKFLKEVLWGELDYLVIDLPPGTGDVQLSLCQLIPLTGALVVTTPQDVALMDVKKAISMFEKVKVPVLGIVENMSGFTCPHCGKQTDVFDKGGGLRAAERMTIPFLGEVPLVPEVRAGSDQGHPIVLTQPDNPAARALAEVAKKLAAQVGIRAAGEPGAKPVWNV